MQALGQWQHFRFRTDVTLYLNDHFGVKMYGDGVGHFASSGALPGSPPAESPGEACEGAVNDSLHWRRASHQGLWVVACRPGDVTVQLIHETDAVAPLGEYHFTILPTGSTITAPPPRTGGGGGGGGFGGPILNVTAVIAGDAPAAPSFGFTYTCANARGEPVRSRTFPLAAGRTYGAIVPAGLSCSLTVSDDGGATVVDGLFTDVVMPPAGYKTTVTFTFGPVPTAVDPATDTVVDEGAVSLTIPEGSRDVPYSVLLETDAESCAAVLDLEGESIACYTVTLFDAEGAEEAAVALLVPATITITLDPARVEELGGLDGVRAARERGELRMLQRDDADAPWREIPFTVQAADDGGVVVVVTVSAFSDFALITTAPRLQTIALHAGWNVVGWDGADGAPVLDALGDATQVDVVYRWVAETQTWRSFRPGAPVIQNGFDTFTRARATGCGRATPSSGRSSGGRSNRRPRRRSVCIRAGTRSSGGAPTEPPSPTRWGRTCSRKSRCSTAGSRRRSRGSATGRLGRSC